MPDATDAAVEAAARGLYEVDHPPDLTPRWEAQGRTVRAAFRGEVRAALSAALPHLLGPIRELHTGGSRGGIWCCTVCRAFPPDYSHPWPCPTVELINELEKGLADE